MTTPYTRAPGFTLVELLIVLTIILLLGGLIIGMPASDQRHAAVRSAAEELAATLRTARSLAINQAIVCGVAFHVQNAPGTSGLVLNNWSGGHSYRIIGAQTPPDEFPTSRTGTYPVPNYVDPSNGGFGNVAQFLSSVEESWIGDPHVLTPRRVRFLALSDQDAGSGGWENTGRIPATYPRPWFGYWAGGTLYPWGGYDGSKSIASRVRDAATPTGRFCSGFYYEGNDGTITGCRNPADRSTTNTGKTGAVPSKQIFKAGDPRPLINSAWLDYVIAFFPDGTAHELTEPFLARSKSFALKDPDVNAPYRQGGTGNGDLGEYSAMRGEFPPMQSYWRHTGRFAITLAPDVERDSDAFASAAEAFRSLMPMHRVTVSVLGDVQVVQVNPYAPPGITFDTTSITSWQTTAQTTKFYQGFIATNQDGTLRTNAAGQRYRPVDTFLTAQILASRQWWGLW